MLKIGLVGGTKRYHGITFCEMFNGYDKDEARKRQWPAIFEARVADQARITHIWEENQDDAREVAEICHIDHQRLSLS